jgi:hypothetical protein
MFFFVDKRINTFLDIVIISFCSCNKLPSTEKFLIVHFNILGGIFLNFLCRNPAASEFKFYQ